jgi:hypothetical protein
MKQRKHSLNFGKKEKVLNYACQTYQLSRPNKVGANGVDTRMSAANH